jgi:uncharacterized membrane protein
MWKRMKRCGELELENILGNLLRAGVILSASVVIIGMILNAITADSTPQDFHVFRGEPAGLRSVRSIVQETFALKPGGIIQFGLLLLLATPVARVAFSIFAFACQKDKVYVLVTVIVLSVLVYSMAGGSL